jgi:hypothetical protein
LRFAGSQRIDREFRFHQREEARHFRRLPFKLQSRDGSRHFTSEAIERAREAAAVVAAWNIASASLLAHRGLAEPTSSELFHMAIVADVAGRTLFGRVHGSRDSIPRRSQVVHVNFRSQQDLGQWYLAVIVSERL